MLSPVMQTILAASKTRGWVLEPDAKQIMREAGLDVPEFRYAHSPAEASRFAAEIGYPLVAKVVSPAVLHKSEVHGVAVGIADEAALAAVYERLCRIDGFSGVHLERMAQGVELIVGAKVDAQFGPVILLGLGGTSVEIYQDVAIRMAPLSPPDVRAMVDSLKGGRLLRGYRGAASVDMEALTRLLMNFSKLVMDLEAYIESIDLNPVLCSADACVIADARMILR